MDALLASLFDAEFEVRTVRECGWNGKKNGELLRLAERGFDAFAAMDRNLEHQQNLSVLDLGVIVLRARSNAYPLVAPAMSEVNEKLRTIRAGEVIPSPVK